VTNVNLRQIIEDTYLKKEKRLIEGLRILDRGILIGIEVDE
jgi:hypothetical protein